MSIFFSTAVAHAVREQVLGFKKALLLSGMLGDLPKLPANEARRRLTSLDPDLASLLIFAEPNRPLLREQTKAALAEWTPLITDLLPEDRGKLDVSMSRQARFTRRNQGQIAQSTGASSGRGARSKRRNATAAANKETTPEIIMPMFSLRSPPRTIRTSSDYKYKAPTPEPPSPPVAKRRGRKPNG